MWAVEEQLVVFCLWTAGLTLGILSQRSEYFLVLCLSLSVLCLSVLSVGLSVCFSVVCLSVLSVDLSVCFSVVCLSVLSVGLSVCFSVVCLSVLSVDLSVCFRRRLPVCLVRRSVRLFQCRLPVCLVGRSVRTLPVCLIGRSVRPACLSCRSICASFFVVVFFVFLSSVRLPIFVGVFVCVCVRVHSSLFKCFACQFVRLSMSAI